MMDSDEYRGGLAHICFLSKAGGKQEPKCTSGTWGEAGSEIADRKKKFGFLRSFSSALEVNLLPFYTVGWWRYLAPTDNEGIQRISPLQCSNRFRSNLKLEDGRGIDPGQHALTSTIKGKMKLISPRSSSKSLKQFAKTQNTEALKTSLMFATLARTAAADSNVKDVEVKKVQEIMRRVASTECSAASINVAAKSHLFENMPLQQFVARAAKCLSLDDRRDVAQAIAEVCQADGRVSEMEAHTSMGLSRH